ncbi:YciI family protein [Asanoa sp. WMMD1127]|uniref:YciI family protein n=1 Tax=Asanoa sp. WMMD1127 TaxID=3016107 RepID=UPI00241798BE|nr:YciI family protein [Asanoa sp. WMMD1127]MDG4821725.1 YciI family protein [Asanoa sp. WMMD1127]
MKYLIMVYGNPRSRAVWDSFTDEQRAAGMAEHLALGEAMTAAGELVLSERLADPSTGTRIPAQPAALAALGLPTDGPFAESKEHLAGFYLVDCPSEERAREWAAKIPESVLGLVEVRPVWTGD